MDSPTPNYIEQNVTADDFERVDLALETAIPSTILTLLCPDPAPGSRIRTTALLPLPVRPTFGYASSPRIEADGPPSRSLISQIPRMRALAVSIRSISMGPITPQQQSTRASPICSKVSACLVDGLTYK
jgi:hypothetical protein